jgi:hypothetical protein
MEGARVVLRGIDVEEEEIRISPPSHILEGEAAGGDCISERERVAGPRGEQGFHMGDATHRIEGAERLHPPGSRAFREHRLRALGELHDRPQEPGRKEGSVAG